MFEGIEADDEEEEEEEEWAEDEAVVSGGWVSFGSSTHLGSFVRYSRSACRSALSRA